ncbi:MAG TPA: DUF523 and DUF1722 domain-containing protein [Anaerolineae bacterium]|nr:DUF523 and DUF1722 domain-containing protein [Anaerolineae bacterium]HQI87041.1 DUF523 and DUF1722 domain-containing protein [Anaerolineae bacterium]
MKPFSRPTIVISKCLGFAACRYNSATIPDAFVEQLKPYVTYLPVCAEVEIGLGVPRDPVRIVLVNDEPRLLQPATGADVTEKMQTFAAKHLDALTDIDGFILKGRSPSCGIKDVKVYRGVEKGAASTNKGRGFFAQAVLERYGHLPVEEEGRLTNFTIREHFLTALFTLADFRAVKAAGAMRELVRFHTDNKLLLLAYSESQYRLMGPIVANHAKKPAAEVIAAYETHLWKALARPARRTAGINVLMHALGYFSESLTSDEKAYFLDALEKYRAEKVPLSVPVSLLGAWIARFKEPYLARQTFFAPYPEELVTISDSGKGRDLS